MNALIIAGAVNAFFFAALVGTKQTKTAADRILALFLALSALGFAIVYAALEWNNDLLLLVLFSNLLYAPLFFLYVETIVDPAGSPPRNWSWHFLPSIAAHVYLITVVSIYSDVELTLLFQVQTFFERPTIHNAFYVVDLLATPVYVVLAHRRLVRHERQIAELYSYRKSVDYRWLRVLLYVVFGTWAVIDLPLLGTFFTDTLTERQSLSVGGSLAALGVLYLGFYGYRQVAVYGGPAAEPAPTANSSANNGEAAQRYQKSGLSPEEIRTYTDHLLAHMAEARPHFNNILTIRDLANAIGLPEHNASEVINVGLGKTFYEFINGYRVNEFKRRVALPECARHTLLAVALECGFNSKSSFNRIFKQQEGTTPSAYVARLKKHAQ